MTNPDQELVGLDEYGGEGGIAIRLPEDSNNEPIMSEVVIKAIKPLQLGGYFRFSWAPSAQWELYEDAAAEIAVDKNKDYDATREWTFYALGTQTSANQDDLEIKVKWINDNGVVIDPADKLRVSVITPELTLHWPGTAGDPGPVVDRAEFLPDGNYTGILQPNQDDDDERSSADLPARDNDDESLGSNDDDLVKLQLDFQPYGMDEGNLELKFDDSAIRVFTEDGTPLTREQLKVDLAAPQGPLADLKTKKMTVFLEGLTNDPSSKTARLVYSRANNIVEDLVELLKMDVEKVDRDDPTKKWGDEEDASISEPIYAGESTGDMIRWSIGDGSLSSLNFTWTAEGPNGETKTGPTGVGKDEWKIADGDSDTSVDWLDWKPGTWTIKVLIGSAEVEFEQEIGWRTEDYAVIGQIVPTNTHDSDAPPLVAVGDNFWEITSPVARYRKAVLFDMADLPLFDGLADSVRNTLTITPLPITEKITELWFGFWAGNPLVLKGPFTSSHLLGHGNVEYGHRFWALQHVLNVSPDTPLVAQSFTPATFSTLRTDEQYRVIQRYMIRFLVTANGKIDSESVIQIHNVAEAGPTKMNIGIAAGEFKPVWDNPPYTLLSLPTQPPETNEHNGVQTVSGDGTKVSYYATGRVGPMGQKANWRLFGKDAPWIFSEIIFELKSDRSVAAEIKTSVDTSWSDTGTIDGDNPFNNLNLYRLQKNLQTNSFEFVRQKLFPMEGELEDFINSASGQRPEPNIPPSVQ